RSLLISGFLPGFYERCQTSEFPLAKGLILPKGFAWDNLLPKHDHDAEHYNRVEVALILHRLIHDSNVTPC
ncbi:MAG: hypothetical protein WCB93_01205, partial [Gallionella sp.]